MPPPLRVGSVATRRRVRSWLGGHPRLLLLARRVDRILRGALNDPGPGLGIGEDGTIRRSLPLPPRPDGRPSRREPLLLVAPADQYVARTLGRGGLRDYEPEALACFLAMTDVAGPGAVLDIGANIGVYALTAAALTDREVLAFEPTPSTGATARRLADSHGLAVDLRSTALGRESGTATFYLSDRTDSSNSLASGFRPSGHQLEVDVRRLDELVAEEGLHPAVLKVDTETTEPDVLAGAAGTISSLRPWILCEVLAGRTETALQQVMEPFGYYFFHVVDEVPWPRATALTGDPTYRHLMWLFAPSEPPAEFWSSWQGWRDALAALPYPSTVDG